MKRTSTGDWLLPNQLHHLAREYWKLDLKDFYGRDNHSIETILNDQLMTLVNNRMFDDEGERDTVSEP